MLASTDPRTGLVGAQYEETAPEKLSAMLEAAQAARDELGTETAVARAAALRELAQRLQESAPEVIACCRAETGLSPQRLTGELERTWRQVLAFAELVQSAAHYEPVIELADPDARPIPRPDLRRMLVPRGPVAVYAASNFPLAFSVAGGDTASALAAGCPVVCKAHPGHPGTSVLIAGQIQAALASQGLPTGMFGLVQTASIDMSLALARDERIEAVAFTGSEAAGRALFDAAAARPRPIPVFAEMGSVNPVVVTAAAIRERGADIAALVAAAVTQNAGQLCTKPGLIFAPGGEEGDRFAAALSEAVGASDPGPMLNRRLLDGALRAEAELDRHEAVRSAGRTVPDGPSLTVPAALFMTTATDLRADPSLHDERFGPIALVVRYADLPDLTASIERLPGQLTGTLHIGEGEREAAREIAAMLVPRVGRLLFGGVPTGVSVTAAMHHGGPYPATTDSAYTSVGTAAIRRFLRPIVWQNAPEWLLPEPLRD